MPLANFSFATMSYNEADEGGENNALHIAAKEGNLAEVQSQVSNFDINVKGEDGVTALYLAANNGSIKVVELLLALDADVNIPNYHGHTALINSCQLGHTDVALGT